MFRNTRLYCLAVTLGAAFLAASVAPRLSADEIDKKTVVTFNAPVDIAGKALPAGTYVFKTLRDDRNIVLISRDDDNQFIGMFDTIGIMDPSVSSEPRIELSEGTANAPQSVHAWFYPGDNTGWEFQSARSR